MSKILIISDSHFLRKTELLKFTNQFQDIQAIIHCGDIYLGYEPNDIERLYICKGNNDFADIPYIRHFTIDGITFTITHGNTNHFAFYPESLKILLEDFPADVICFGHSHIPYFYQDQDVMIINPGSLTLGRSYPRINTYAIFDTHDKTVQFYNAKNNESIDINQFK